LISKIKTFLRLIRSIITVLNKKEINALAFSFFLSTVNTVLELISITTIVYLLLVIAGENISESRISYFFNSILPENDIIMSAAIIMILVIIIKTIFQVLFNWYQENISQKVQNRFNNTLFTKFINLKYEVYINENSPRILRLLSVEAVKLGNQLINPVMSIINESLLLLFISLFIFLYDPILGLVVFGTSIILIFHFSSVISNRIRILGKTYAENNNHRIKSISEVFKSFDLIKIYNSQKSFISKYKIFTNNINKSGALYNFFAKLPKSIFELFIFLFLFGLIITLYYTNNKDLLISYLSILAVSVYKVIPSLNKISHSLQTIQYYSSPFKELVSLLQLKEEVPYIKEVESFNTIFYNNLSFSYGGNKNILNSISLEISKNDFIGIYGSSGSGKSTLIKLLCGLLKPDSGIINVDNKKINHNIIHNYFSYVPQEPFVLNENIIQNISFSEEVQQIDFSRIKNVLKKVELFDIFKDKLYEPLGENGIKISGGQKQRIAIARALYFDKKVIVLDESTSNLDPKTEEKIINLLIELNKIVTIIFVSHKKQSLVNCNKLLEIKNNKIIRVQ